MLRPRQLLMALEALQIGIAERVGDRTAEALADPRRHSGAGPALMTCHGRRQGHAPLLLLRQLQRGRRAMGGRVTAIAHAVRALAVIALGDLPDPVGRVAGDRRDLTPG